MSWAKLDDGMWSHPKFLDLSNGAIGVWAKALSWSAQQLRDGAIPRALKSMLRATDAEVAELVDAGLWDETETGWEIHDYLVFNPSRESVLGERDKGKARAQKSYERRKAKSDSSPEETKFFAVSSPDPSRPVPTRPENSNQRECVAETNASVPRPPIDTSKLQQRPEDVGFRFVASLLGRSTFDVAPVGSYPREYAWIGSKPTDERERVRVAVEAEQYFVDNPAWCDAKKLVLDWQKLLAGRPKPLARAVAIDRREQLDKARERLRAARIEVNRLDGLPWFDRESPKFPARRERAAAEVTAATAALAELERGGAQAVAS